MIVWMGTRAFQTRDTTRKHANTLTRTLTLTITITTTRVLRDLSNTEFNYNQTAAAVRDYDGINPETDHHQSKVRDVTQHLPILCFDVSL